MLLHYLVKLENPKKRYRIFTLNVTINIHPSIHPSFILTHVKRRSTKWELHAQQVQKHCELDYKAIYNYNIGL